MKTLEITGLKDVKKVSKGLQSLLADLQVHYTNLRGFHWNIKGKKFFFLHEKFEQLYDETASMIDEVAERLLMLGETPAHTFSEYLKKSSIRETGIISDGDEAVKNILETYKHLIATERALIADASDAGDEATVALISDYISSQEKEVWMLTSYLS